MIFRKVRLFKETTFNDNVEVICEGTPDEVEKEMKNQMKKDIDRLIDSDVNKFSVNFWSTNAQIFTQSGVIMINYYTRGIPLDKKEIESRRILGGK